MKWDVGECVSLAEYRECVLRLTQAEVAVTGKTSQGWISQIEQGHLPRPKQWAYLLKAYGLDRIPDGERHFVRLVEGARIIRAMRRPITDDYPLFAVACHGDQGAVAAEFASSRTAASREA
jgi:hypothetical protein